MNIGDKVRLLPNKGTGVIKRIDEGFYWVNGRPYTKEQIALLPITHDEVRDELNYIIADYGMQYYTDNPFPKTTHYIKQNEAQSKRLAIVEELLDIFERSYQQQMTMQDHLRRIELEKELEATNE
jgi:hypothetical protein